MLRWFVGWFFLCLFDCYVYQPLPSSLLMRYDGDGGDDEQIFKQGLSFFVTFGIVINLTNTKSKS